MQRRRICFIHIPKCAGTSIFNALKGYFPHARRRQLNPAAARQGATSIGRGLDFRSDILAYHLYEDVDLVFGHYQITEQIMLAHPEYDFIAVFRDPVERFISNFYYNSSRPEWAKLFGGTIEQFIDGPREQPEFLGHSYIRFLGLTHPRKRNSIDAAMRTLERFAIVGITERLSDFAAVFRDRYGLELEIKHDNETALKRPTLHRSELSKIEEFCAPNRTVYEYAKANNLMSAGSSS